MVMKSFRSSTCVGPCLFSCQEKPGAELQGPVEAAEACVKIQLQTGCKEHFVFLPQAEIGRIITTPHGRRANDMPNKILIWQWQRHMSNTLIDRKILHHMWFHWITIRTCGRFVHLSTLKCVTFRWKFAATVMSCLQFFLHVFSSGQKWHQRRQRRLEQQGPKCSKWSKNIQKWNAHDFHPWFHVLC